MSLLFPRHRRNPDQFSEVRSSMRHIRDPVFLPIPSFLESAHRPFCCLFFLVGILDLVTEFADCAIGFDLGRIATDSVGNYSCGRHQWVWVLSLRTHRHGTHRKNGNYQFWGHDGLF